MSKVGWIRLARQISREFLCWLENLGKRFVDDLEKMGLFKDTYSMSVSVLSLVQAVFMVGERRLGGIRLDGYQGWWLCMGPSTELTAKH